MGKQDLQDFLHGCVGSLCMKLPVQAVEVCRNSLQHRCHLGLILAGYPVQVKAGIPICCVYLA